MQDISLIIAVGEFVAICFMIPMIKKQNEIEKLLHEMDKKLMSPEEMQDQIDLAIYRHMNKCEAHKQHFLQGEKAA